MYNMNKLVMQSDTKENTEILQAVYVCCLFMQNGWEHRICYFVACLMAARSVKCNCVTVHQRTYKFCISVCMLKLQMC
jgi:hypothetical protein